MSVSELAGSAINTIGALGTAVYNRQTQAGVNRLNVALAGQQNAWNLAQWMRENSYNDPSAQVKRLREAGLNPALAMTQSGLVDAGNAMPGRPAAEARAVAPAPLDPLTLAQTRLLNAQADNLSATTPGHVKLQDAEYKKLLKDMEESDSRIGLNAATIAHMSAEEKQVFARLELDAARLELDRDNAKAQIDLWNSQIGYNDALKLRTQEEYNELVAFRELKRRGLDLSNREIQSRLNLNEAQINHYEAIANDMDRRFDAEYGPEGTAQFQKQLMKDQAHLAKKQAEYWDDYVKDPKKYQSRVKKTTKEAFENATTYEYE